VLREKPDAEKQTGESESSAFHDKNAVRIGCSVMRPG